MTRFSEPLLDPGAINTSGCRCSLWATACRAATSRSRTAGGWPYVCVCVRARAWLDCKILPRVLYSRLPVLGLSAACSRLPVCHDGTCLFPCFPCLQACAATLASARTHTWGPVQLQYNLHYHSHCGVYLFPLPAGAVAGVWAATHACTRTHARVHTLSGCIACTDCGASLLLPACLPAGGPAGARAATSASR